MNRVQEQRNMRQSFSLYELNTLIKAALGQSFPDVFWVTAEIADSKRNQKGHCYLELVEKDDDRTIAQMKATIWSYEYRKLSLKFENVTNESLKMGMKVLLLVSVTFHEVYGLSLTVKDLDPSYTLGEMARRKKEVIDRLRKEGIIDMNKRLPLPAVPQRIAVISSPTAAGYGDFFNQLDKNPYGYTFIHILFPAVMQGHEAETSIISSLNEIKMKRHHFDVVVIIRGGGSTIDLNCFDGYPLASHVAGFPLPVLTGIGHERDDTVADIVAHTKMKTPTAVAEFLISGMKSFEETIIDAGKKVLASTERLLKDENFRLHTVSRRMALIPLRLASSHSRRVLILHRDLENRIRQLMGKEDSRFTIMEQAIKHLDPANILRRGYSITRHRGNVIKDASSLKKWAVIETMLHKGNVTSIVQQGKEVREREQKQTENLLPGFDRA